MKKTALYIFAVLLLMPVAANGRNLPADPGATTPLWELKLGLHQYSIPTVDGGRIFLAVDDSAVQQPGYQPTGGGVLMCVEQATGKLVWELPSPRYMEGVKPPFHFDQWKCGICSRPVVDGARVFVVGNRGEVLCADRDRGTVVWRYSFITELGVVPHDVCGSTLLIVEDLVFACTSNGLDDRHDKVPAPLARRWSCSTKGRATWSRGTRSGSAKDCSTATGRRPARAWSTDAR